MHAAQFLSHSTQSTHNILGKKIRVISVNRGCATRLQLLADVVCMLTQGISEKKTPPLSQQKHKELHSADLKRQ